MLTLNKEVEYESTELKFFEKLYGFRDLEEWSQNLEKKARQAFQDFLGWRENVEEKARQAFQDFLGWREKYST